MRLLRDIMRSRLVGYIVGLLATIAFGSSYIETEDEADRKSVV